MSRRFLAAILSSTVAVAANLAPTAIVNLGMQSGDSRAITADSSGNYYVAGIANNHVLVVKVSPSGAILYSRAFGGSSYEIPGGIAVDTSGAVYVVGNTASTDFPLVGAYLASGTMFLTKLSSDGSTILYSTYIASDVIGTAKAAAVDAAGSAYVTGNASSTGFTTTPGAFITTAPMYQENAFVLKVAPDGSRPVWATLLAGNGIACATLSGVTCPLSTPASYFNNSEQDTGRAIAVDASGNVYVAGSTNSAGFPVTNGVVQTQYADPHGVAFQGFVTKLSADGSSLLYSTYLGTAYGEYLFALALDSEGEAIVGGVTDSSAFPTTPGAPLPRPLHGGGGFLAMLDAQASSFVYATYTGEGNVTGIAADTAGNVYVTGGFANPSFPITPGGLPPGSLYFGSFTALDPEGTLIFSTTLPNGAAGLVAAGSPASVALAGVAGLTIFGPRDPSAPAAFAFGNAAFANGVGAVVSAQVAPGELIWLFGVNFGSAPSVTFDGVAAPILAVQPNQILIQVPFEVAGHVATSMQISGGPQTLSLGVVPADPGVFIAPGSNVTTPLNQDGTLNGPNNPALLGSIMTVFVTGSGLWTGGMVTGEIASDTLVSPQLPISVLVTAANTPPVHIATVLYAGSAPTQSDGVMQINFVLPISPDLTFNPLAWVTVQAGTAQSPGILVSVSH